MEVLQTSPLDHLGTAPQLTSISQIHPLRLAKQSAVCITRRGSPFRLSPSAFWPRDVGCRRLVKRKPHNAEAAGKVLCVRSRLGRTHKLEGKAYTSTSRRYRADSSGGVGLM